MKPASLLLLLLLFISSAVVAQTHTLKLDKQSLPAIQRNFYIEQVLDTRIATGAIGEVQKGIVNNKAAAFFANPLEQELLEFIATHHPKEEGQLPIILRVNKLWVSEHTTMNSETATAEAIVDFVYKQDSVYHKLYTATVRTSQSGLDVTKKHEPNIATVLYNCLKQLSTRDFNTLLAHAEPLTPNQVNKPYNNTIVTQSYPVLQTEAPAEGIYMTLDEFRNNTPGITSGYDIRHRSAFENAMVGGGEVVPMLVTPEGKTKAVRNAWGFTQGPHTYINYGGIFYPLASDGQTFAFIGPPVYNGSGAVVAGAVVGGAIGGAIAGGIVAATSKPAKYTLDLVTGAIHYNGKPVGMNTADAKLILYRQAKGETTSPVRLRLNGEEQTLHANELIEVPLSTTDAGTSVCIVDDEGNCINFMPIPNRTYYIACSSKSEKANLKEMDKAQGEFDVKGIVFAQKKESKKKK